MAELIDWLQSAPFGALALVTALLSAVVAVVVIMLTRMKMTNKDKSSCDFGQYDELWKNHKYSCMKIIRITNDYIVHVDTQHNIDWETTEAYDSTKTEEEKIASEKALSHCLIAERKPIGGLSNEAVLSFKTIIGEAIVNCLEKNYEGTYEILKLADEFRVDRVIEKSREWYLVFTTLITATVILITLLINSKSILFFDELLPYINIGTWAIAGACLSIILRSGNLKNASYSGQRLHFVESGCRLVGGFVTGQIVYLGIKSGVLFSSLIGNSNSQYMIYLLALLAGASERFAPSIITKIDEPTLTTETTKEN